MTDPAFVTPPLAIETSYLDHNGHVNMAYHLVLADTALDLAFSAFKAGPEFGQRGLTTFAGEMHVRYLAEMNFGDEIVGRVILIESDAKRARWAVELVRRPDETVVTTVEGVSLVVSLETRRVAQWPDDVRALIEATVERCRPAAAELDWLGRSVGMRR
ncbi:acyl-CoA thioesterase [Methylopila turkensis]|uniref:Thioesterase n=1 Tax=Methylopila turkensis TaxID=1437816 RepID=A0A9W6N734_9HYPH|nr:thioesterase family protein [Methylopila turkensis]GLK79946.1 thioesterase [Methylopila turkensis]